MDSAPLPDSSGYPRSLAKADIRHTVASSVRVLEQPSPPSLQEILSAYRAKGDGDRSMLLAMLNAKAAEDQRIAAMANLHRTVLDVHQASFEPIQPPHINNYNHPTSFIQSIPPRHGRPRQYRETSRSWSPPQTHSHIAPRSEVPIYLEPPPKRHRGSHSPLHAGAYESRSGSQQEQFPPSPYSSSDRSNSAEYSPGPRQSMAINSLLSSRATQADDK